MSGQVVGPAPHLPALLEPDPLIDAFKKDVDRTLLRENLRLTPEQRILKLQDFVSFATELREKGRAVQS